MGGGCRHEWRRSYAVVRLFGQVSAKTGQNVEEAFLRTARKIYENIQSGALDLNAAESGVVTNKSKTTKVKAGDGSGGGSGGCSC